MNTTETTTGTPRLAEGEGCELVTADDPFARGLRPSYPFIVSLVALP